MRITITIEVEAEADPWTQQERDQGWRYVDKDLRDPLVYAMRQKLYP